MSRFYTFSLIILVFATSLSPAFAASYDCTPYVEPQIVVLPLYAQPHTDDSVSLGQIREYAGSKAPEYSGSIHEIPVGLTASNLSMQSSFEVSTRSRSSNPMVCAQITKFTLHFGYPDTTVYLAHDLLRDSCSYNTIMGHELKHVNVDQHILATYLPQLPALLAGALRQVGVIRTSSAANAESQFQKIMDQYTRELGASIATVRDRWQQQVDAPEEYRRISQSCNGNISRLVSEAGVQ